MTPDKSAPTVLNSKQVADRFGVTTDAVRGWCEAGKIRFFRTPGGHHRFYLDDVEALAADERPGPTSAVAS